MIELNLEAIREITRTHKLNHKQKAELEKIIKLNTPQKPIIDENIYKIVGGGKCPNCKKEFAGHPLFCDECSQSMFVKINLD